ncbi:uncharacterized protein LOC101850477 [Aplysia californica]|uniref:Uncharacterized protein LOC101850477 n=1 Tax=Aplysia californica TaxID=6500 RepID=A0ABM1A0J4_APLCA|nr:uncharacterized protein LOC101850477 [Aplysia californica]
MRPDEHKKKKNAAYKKKHGVSKDKDKELKDGVDASSSKDRKTATGEKHRGAQQKGKKANGDGALTTPSNSSFAGCSTALVDSDCSESSSSDSEVERKHVPAKKKTFQRRQIVSNWQKYELGPEMDDDVSKGGKDYKELLSMAGESMSHFRFTDELEWEEQGAGSTSPHSLDTYSSVLSLNPAEIAESLSCLPVHTILNLSKDLFPAEELANSVQRASEKQAQYDLERNHHDISQQQLHDKLKPSQQVDVLSGLDDTTEQVSMISSDTVIKRDLLSFSLRNSKNSQEADKAQRNEMVSSKTAENTDCPSSSDDRNNKAVCLTGQTSDGVIGTGSHSDKYIKPELDLDSLLDLDIPDVGRQESGKLDADTAVSQPNKLEPQNIGDSIVVKAVPDKVAEELDLDSLLELDTPSIEACAAPQQATHEAQKTSSKAESAQLEDWLDSVLDD